MTPFTKLVRLATAIGISVALGACGGSAKSPVAPSNSATPPANATAPTLNGASIDGTVAGVSGAQRLGMRGMAAGPSVTVAGTSISSPIDASGHFSLQGVPNGDVQLQITVSGTTATLVITGVSDHEQIHLTIQVSGTTATADDSDRETSDNGVEVEGRITAISGNTLTVAGKVITVPTGTPIHHGGTAIPLSSLTVGERIHVHGMKAGSGVTATDIEVQTDNGNPSPEDNAEVNGAVSGRSGTCPSLTFKVGTTTVTTDASTKFEDTTCSTLANGDTVEVQGTKQANGSILAQSVEKSGGGDNEVQVDGTVASKTGTCPTLTFTVGTTMVTTNASTKFEDTSCSTLANGDSVQVEGTKQTNGSVLAASVDKKGK